MLFSQRYLRALEAQTLTVEISDAARRKLWSWLSANNTTLHIQRDPNDSWVSNSSILEETETDLLIEHGWDGIPGVETTQEGVYYAALKHLFLHGDGAWVFDAIELAGRIMDAAEKEALRQKTNEIFEVHSCPWRLSDGEFFKLDGDFVGARLASAAHDALAANQFSGATDEYAKARQYLASGDVRQAIHFSASSFESVMKKLAGVERGTADALIKTLSEHGYFDDLPEVARPGFKDQVLKALPFLRNNLGGHGQGASVVMVPRAYGDLAVQLAAVFHNFLISKHLERTQDEPEPEIISSNDRYPF